MSFVPLDSLAEVSLGFKSLQNNFFYVSEATIETYKIEKRFLKPILMLRDLDSGAYLQNVDAQTWLFHCQERMLDLRGTGALRYIETMADHTASEKKQSGKGTTIKKALEAQGGGLWYAPKALPHKRNIWIRKGISGIFAPFLFETEALADQRLQGVTARVELGITWEELAAVLTLSAFAYSVEINGSSSMGAGVLEAPTTKIRGYPVLDLQQLKKTDRTRLVSLARSVWLKESPVDWSQGKAMVGKHLEALDEWMLQTIGSKVTTTVLYKDLHEACLARVGLAKDKVKKVNKKKTDNIGNVAESIAATILPKMKSKNFPEDFIDGELDMDFQISRELVKAIQLAPLLDQMDLLFLGDNEKVITEVSHPQAQAESIARAVLWGRSSFQLSSHRNAMQKGLTEFLRWVKSLDKEINQAIADSALGTGYEIQLRVEVLRRLGIHPVGMEVNLPATISMKC